LTIVPDVESVDAAARLPDGSPLKRVFVPERRFLFTEVRMTVRSDAVATALDGRRFALFDLTHPCLAPSPHAVAWIGHSWERLAFAFVPDIHLAEAWDLIQADALQLETAVPDATDRPRSRLGRIFSRQAFIASFINPNQQWRALIHEANARARRGELDLVIVGGDLVEYQLAANLRLFEDMVTGKASGGEPLEVPLFTVPGNHDYRRFPYRPQIYPLDRCGLHDLQRDHFFRHARGERRTRLSLRDARAVLAPDRGRHPLAEYLLRIDPRPDDILRLGRTDFVFLDTGRDVFCSLARIRPLRWGNYVRAVRHSWRFPGSAGLADAQAARLEREAADGTATNLIVVFHAGLTAGPGEDRKDVRGAPEESGMTGPARSLRSAFAVRDGLWARARLEKALARAGFSRGGLFQNQISFFRAAATSGRNVLGLSGHFHRPIAFRLDKASGDLRFEGPLEDAAALGSFKGSSFFIGGAALGHIDPRSDPSGQPGFTCVEVAGDRIVSVRRETQLPPGRMVLRVWARRSEAGMRPASLSVALELPESEARSGPLAVDIAIIIFSRSRRGTPGGFPFTVEEVTAEGLRSGEPRWIDRGDRMAFFGRHRPAFFTGFRGASDREREFLFIPTGRAKRRAKAVVAVEILARRDGAWTSVGTAWHPLWIEVGTGGRRRIR
jgi:3',5'-cyclic AMP phosphodiesterase CpdA